jgi:uncharacterized protein (TIGR03083 family)
MAPLNLPFPVYLDAIGEAAERLYQCALGRLADPVPTCPEWTLDDLVAHLTHVYRHWHAQVLGADPDHPSRYDDAVETPGNPLERMEQAATELLGALERLGPDAPSWNWSGEDLTTGWVARRMALESAVHRVDAELAIGQPSPVERELAVDGIDERIDVHLRVDVAEAPSATLHGTLCLVCSDDAAAFVIEVGGGRLRWRRGRGPADAALVGTASNLFLFTWNRVGLEAIELTGEREVAEAWRSLPG